MRLLCLGALLVSGCQCFVPVDEPDAGVDAGTIVDAGCRPSQCTGPQLTSTWCNTLIDAGFSCVDDRCVWECPLVTAGRTCSASRQSPCLDCGDAGTSCPQTSDAGSSMVTASVEPGAACTPFNALTFLRLSGPQDHYLFSTDVTLETGELWRLESGEYLVYFPLLGGWCTGRSAFTGAPRSIFNCPSCQFVLMGFE